MLKPIVFTYQGAACNTFQSFKPYVYETLIDIPVHYEYLNESDGLKILPFTSRVDSKVVINANFGFPTMNTLNYSFEVTDSIKVNVFGQESKGLSIINTLKNEMNELYMNFLSAKDAASELLGKICYFNWPHHKKGLIVAVYDKNDYIELIGNIDMYII